LAQSLPTTVVAYTGQAIDGGLGTYGTLGAFPRLGASGHVAFSSFFAGAPSPDDFGYFVGQPGALQVVIRENSDEGGPELFDGNGNGNVGVGTNGKIVGVCIARGPHAGQSKTSALRTDARRA
jgi:hypothetical protein